MAEGCCRSCELGLNPSKKSNGHGSCKDTTGPGYFCKDWVKRVSCKTFHIGGKPLSKVCCNSCKSQK